MLGGPCDSCGDGMGPCGYGRGPCYGRRGVALRAQRRPVFQRLLLPRRIPDVVEQGRKRAAAGGEPRTRTAGTSRCSLATISLSARRRGPASRRDLADAVGTLGVGGDVLLPGAQVDRFQPDHSGTPSLLLPYYDVSVPGAQTVRIASPDFSSGSVTASASTELQSANVVLRRAIAQYPELALRSPGRLPLRRLARGPDARHGDDAGLAPATVISTLDSSSTPTRSTGPRSVFHAGRSLRLDDGSPRRAGRGRHPLRGHGVRRNGTATSQPPTQAITAASGYLGPADEHGPLRAERLRRDSRSLAWTLGYELTPRIHATVGYSLFYWSNVARPGDQIDTNLNSTRLSSGTLSGVPPPNSASRPPDFWAQGLSLGFDCPVLKVTL